MKNKVGRPFVSDKKRNKTLKLSSVAHEQLKELSLSENISQAVIVETLINKAILSRKLLN
ncbi:MAG: hypothetical protein L3J83_09505 [Proteobacteria bacterium]|nr:hypothetical protein [Pseudomonadota bacterium]